LSSDSLIAFACTEKGGFSYELLICTILKSNGRAKFEGMEQD
jgi:hypothetical protein